MAGGAFPFQVDPARTVSRAAAAGEVLTGALVLPSLGILNRCDGWAEVPVAGHGSAARHDNDADDAGCICRPMWLDG